MNSAVMWWVIRSLVYKDLRSFPDPIFVVWVCMFRNNQINCCGLLSQNPGKFRTVSGIGIPSHHLAKKIPREKTPAKTCHMLRLWSFNDSVHQLYALTVTSYSICEPCSPRVSEPSLFTAGRSLHIRKSHLLHRPPAVNDDSSLTSSINMSTSKSNFQVAY